VRVVAVSLLPIAIALAVGGAMAVLWWVFDAAPPGSRRQKLDAATRSWGERQRQKGNRRVSYRLWLASTIAVLVLLVWIALSNR